MKSRTITIITSLFALVLIGIIVIQAWWIHRSLQLNIQQFDAATYRSLESVVKQTEQKEDVVFMQNAIGFDSILNTKKPHPHKKIEVHHPAGNSLVIDITNNVSVLSHNGKTMLKVERYRGNTGRMSKCFFFYDNPDSGYVYVNNSTSTETEENPMIQITERMEKIGNIDTLIEKMIHIKSPDSLTVKPADIQRLIQGQLAENDLPDVFHFALLKSNGKYVYKEPDFYDTTNCYKISLYPNDLFGRNILLFVDIPGKLKFIHSDIWWVFVLSLILTISLLILFLYSIRMLIRHKNLLAAKNDFINHMSHEIKTPLAGISLGADMLIEKNDIMTQEQISKVAHSIKEQTSRLNKDMSAVLLNSLVDEPPPMKFVPFSLVNTIHHAVNDFKLILEDKNARVETHFPREKIMLNGNEMLWQKALCNLIDNSIKFSSGGGLVITIGVSFPNPNSILIRVSDNGVGISKEDISHIFEKFYRSNYYKQSHIQGFGLGLSFVKKVVEMHNGSIKAESEPRKGTSIYIELPFHD